MSVYAILRLEFGHIEYDTTSLLLAPILAIIQGVHLSLLQNAKFKFYLLNHKSGHDLSDPEHENNLFEKFALYYTGFSRHVDQNNQ